MEQWHWARREAMENEAVLTKLDELRKSMEAFNESLDRVRYDDFKTAFYEQIQNIFGRHSKTLFDSGMEAMSEFSSCVHKKECMVNFERSRKEVLAAFQRDDMHGALMVLEDAEAQLTYDDSMCTDKRCSHYTMDTLHQIKALFSISDNLKFRNYIQPETSFSRLTSNGRLTNHRAAERKEPTSVEVADTISILANPWRLEVLKLLAQQEQSFSDMSKALDLKTGHLQFHLKVLQEAGCIKNNPRRRMYSITLKGSTALDGIQGLADRLL
jgi:DNA-binding HxlR family transcriptional regulator